MINDASSGTSETSDVGQSSAVSDTPLDDVADEMGKAAATACDIVVTDAHTTLRAAMEDGTVVVQDFAFAPGDERRAGVGSVIPRKFAGHVALYDFVAESANELSVAAGQQVHVLRDSDAGWVVAQIDGGGGVRRGLVPEAYLAEI